MLSSQTVLTVGKVRTSCNQLLGLLTSLQYLAGAGVVGCSLAVGGLWWFQRSLIYPSYAPQGSRIREWEWPIHWSYQQIVDSHGCNTAAEPFVTVAEQQRCPDPPTSVCHTKM